ncbi:gamma-glutamylcyclotransferase family protein [Burkholderia stagnalis]|uniref:UDP-N-acetylmuramate--alanine ligase n=1 Tax=Burkholderia stagnalis TaxID=1503054 RepID=A0A108GAU1_9BURK|nr:gamma-glutamylcyclotransferase family protein [Burkholderia stagnalis]KVZ18587.1 UDP-N-acetylmuramate--alanine ligase [Burkholderia stagnalis]KWA45995.1 UDP-N-acetylmuramate--alanine ligase [Burkholderia stagnalis]KWA52414.1 UDP-N-acetylmuramate--alanine ligase [Burkholderia stagnalis]KWA62014.1 UDP-N-acetylmuramate--alanine ligase [Burkholderia stagnalis]KWC90737.1 UDP-N-acetylmuramate--alanine ligase [Burkholderia stagnalis]
MTATPGAFSERLFSYGTLQLEQVQLTTFGRKLDGQSDEMPGYALSMLKIEDPAVVATSGNTHHPVVAYTGNPADRVSGMVFPITAAELKHADDYEVSSYRRDRVVLASGVPAWVYVDAGSAHAGQKSKKP